MQQREQVHQMTSRILTVLPGAQGKFLFHWVIWISLCLYFLVHFYKYVNT